METLQGKGVFGGIAIGEIAFYKRAEGQVQRKRVEDIKSEILRFETAKEKRLISWESCMRRQSRKWAKGMP